MNPIQYAKYARNEYSQFGEDGILESILEKIQTRDCWCVEFGAWDGIHLSNTFNLIKNAGYRSLLIEADKNKFKVLQRNMARYDAILVNKFVTLDGEDSLDNILGITNIPLNFDFLSIDIDGNDYWIFKSLERYRPKVICIEYNPTIPNEVEYIQQPDFSINRGASALSICKLAKEKSYELVATTRCNLIFVDKCLFHLFSIDDNRLTTLRDDSDSRVFTYSGYDGTIMYSAPVYLMWHDIRLGSDKIQGLPRVLRRFPPNFNFAQRVLFIAFRILIEPRRALLKVFEKR